MKTRRQREGFTLVELLVVITIIGMLMALLLPAIQAAREAGRRAQCMNSEKNLATAMLSLESARGVFPGLLNELGKDGSSVPYYGSWVVMILPYMERGDLYEYWTNLTPAGTPQHLALDPNGNPYGFVNIPLLVCPSNPTTASPGQTPNAYRVNAGRRGPSSPVDTSKIQDTTACGVFDLVSSSLTSTAVPVAMRVKNTAMSIDGIRDGASNTLMLAENTRPANWTAGTDLDLGNLWKSDVPYTVGTDTFYKCEAALGFRIPDSTTSDEGLEFAINKNVDGRPTGEPRGASPASYHPGGVIVAFCDGHVRFLEESIDPNTYLHLMTPSGKKAREWGIANGVDYFKDMYGVLDESN